MTRHNRQLRRLLLTHLQNSILIAAVIVNGCFAGAVTADEPAVKNKQGTGGVSIRMRVKTQAESEPATVANPKDSAGVGRPAEVAPEGTSNTANATPEGANKPGQSAQPGTESSSTKNKLHQPVLVVPAKPLGSKTEVSIRPKVKDSTTLGKSQALEIGQTDVGPALPSQLPTDPLALDVVADAEIESHDDLDLLMTDGSAATSLEADTNNSPDIDSLENDLKVSEPPTTSDLGGSDSRLAKEGSDSETESTDKSTDLELSDAPGDRAAASNKPESIPSGKKPLPLSASNAKALKDRSESNELIECPGSPDDPIPHTTQPDDIPLVQEEHPFDAPDAEASEQPKESPKTLATYSPRQLQLKTEIDKCLSYFESHPENTTRRGPWAMMHATLPYGVKAEIIAGNRQVNAIGWMAFNGVCAKQRLFQPTKTGFRMNVGPGVQGHEGQFLAILAQCQVRPDYPIQVGNRKYTVMDLVKYEMGTCREKTELTFKLIGISHYMDTNQRWRDSRGRNWNLEKVVAEELAQPVIGAACGGTHRLMGLTYSVIKRQQSGQPITGHWKRAETFVSDFVEYTFRLQNSDGSFSTEWFEGRGASPDIERKVQTTGHISEWLVYTLPDSQLDRPEVVHAIEFLAKTYGGELDRDWPIGPRGHSLRAMQLYRQRVFGTAPAESTSRMATQGKSSTR